MCTIPQTIIRISRNTTITLSYDGSHLRHRRVEARQIGTMRVTGGGFHLPVSASDLGA
jgi:hypothetical protein